MRITATHASLISILIFFSFSAPSQPVVKRTSVFDYLTQDESAKIHLELDLGALLKNRRNDQYVPAILTGPDNRTYKLEVRTRGKYRRRKCEIPPVKFKFSKKELESYQLDTFNEIKLALPCSAESASEDLIVREYLAYRMFESLSPCSTRARLVRLELKNTSKKRPQKMVAMLVEHEEETAARLRAMPIQEWGIAYERFNTEQVAMMALFQYMIGNTDWDLQSCRNILVLKPGDNDKLLPVPFDFDFSGLVNAPYASPNSASGLKQVQDRFLMAEGIDREALLKAKAAILAAKPTLMHWCDSAQLSGESLREMRLFLERFFTVMAESPEIPVTMEMGKK